MIIYLPLLVCFAGLIMFLIAKANPDVKRLGELMFFAGLFVSLLNLAHMVKVLP